ncbi:hypothetical protein GH714_000448 [Hevea brasiliensis]|uniref:Uncharacterized protein n=1 Tax=Hevea brasiliensis TaxID=3981 RepID=A0A6A6MKB9_HEVBR|nr:hypothetical protein GH714_000448 [Hevea brasiliensis]
MGRIAVSEVQSGTRFVEFSDRVSGEELASNFVISLPKWLKILQCPESTRLASQSCLSISVYQTCIFVENMYEAKWLVESMLVPLRLFQERCESLIGHFDLDPNRVFDIFQSFDYPRLIPGSHCSKNQVLEFFELQPDNTIFLGLIPIFPKSHASQNQRIEVNSHVPFGLYKLTALLVKEEFIDPDNMNF